MSIRGFLKRVRDVFSIKHEYVYNRNGALPVYIIDNRIYRIKREDICRVFSKEDGKALSEAALKHWGYGMKSTEEKPTAEAGETPETAPKNSLRRPEGAD